MTGIQRNIRSLIIHKSDGEAKTHKNKETFFTVIGCMDGRCQQPVMAYGKRVFKAMYSDTITEAGIVGLLSSNLSQKLLKDLEKKILISLKKHKSKGIIVHGHTECAGNPVSDDLQKKHIKKSVEVVSNLIGSEVPVVGVFVKRMGAASWVIEEVIFPKGLAKGQKTYPFTPIPRIGIRRKLSSAFPLHSK